MPQPSPSKQPRIDTTMTKQAQEAYTKLMGTAYELATHSKPFTDFELLVKIQKQNGVPWNYAHV